MRCLLSSSSRMIFSKLLTDIWAFGTMCLNQTPNMSQKLSPAMRPVMRTWFSCKNAMGTVWAMVCVAAWKACSQERPTANAKLLMILRMAFSRFFDSKRCFDAASASASAVCRAAIVSLPKEKDAPAGNSSTPLRASAMSISSLGFSCSCKPLGFSSSLELVFDFLMSSASMSNAMIEMMAKPVKKNAQITCKKWKLAFVKHKLATMVQRRTRSQLVLMAIVPRMLSTQRLIGMRASCPVFLIES
mmetsp:Transcript_81840/g.229562  ORF Transcript_81840/g.229562 Transcript_81840/m.229562 type:complete len:245 (-) Transcript_81840:476-1210(-)